jgi:hypothetical protein
MKGFKGISLPVNFIVILAVAVVVMLIVVILMTGVITPTGTVNDIQAWSIGCERLIQRGCRGEDVERIIITGYDPNGDGQWDNLLTACQRRLGRDYTPEMCREACCRVPEKPPTNTTP